MVAEQDWLIQLLAVGVRDVHEKMPRRGSYVRREVSKVDTHALHYVGVPAIPGQTGMEAVLSAANYHVYGHGWPGPGYMAYVDVDGVVWLLNDAEVACYNVGGHNEHVFGTCLQGGGAGWVPNEKQMAALRVLHPALERIAGHRLVPVGHRDLPGQATQCPGERRLEWVPHVKGSQARPEEDQIRFFPETGHAIAFGFKDFWEKNGGLQIFGYPLTDEVQEDGRTVQYFERAKFEYWPENPEQYRVQLARLGAMALEGRRQGA